MPASPSTDENPPACGAPRASSAADQRVVEESDDTAFVLLRLGGDAGDVLRAGHLPDLLGLVGGRVEQLVRLALGAALSVLAVDEAPRGRLCASAIVTAATDGPTVAATL